MGFQDQLSLNAGQKYCRMLQGEHSAILSTCINLPHGFKTFVLSFFEWPLKTGFTVTDQCNTILACDIASQTKFLMRLSTPDFFSISSFSKNSFSVNLQSD